jgi:hypothetical protein
VGSGGTGLVKCSDENREYVFEQDSSPFYKIQKTLCRLLRVSHEKIFIGSKVIYLSL